MPLAANGSVNLQHPDRYLSTDINFVEWQLAAESARQNENG